MESTSISARRQRSKRSPTKSTSPPKLTPDSNGSHSDEEEPHIDIDMTFDDSTTQPKIEELDDDILHVYDLEEAKPVVVTSPSLSPPSRKRGRPRKNPSVEPKKVSFARSKTGCGTCRRRKKKCDETRPGCDNCKKNNVECDGYEPAKPWQSGRQKGLTLAVRSQGMPMGLPQMIPGVDHGTVDGTFFQHFNRDLMDKLSLSDHYNPFKDIIMPMAMANPGLMHCILYLSGSFLVANESNMEWDQRQLYHSNKASESLRESLNLNQSSTLDVHDRSSFTNGDLTTAQSLVLFLATVCAGAIHGEYRLHLNAVKVMLTEAHLTLSLANEKLRQFLLEFILYHDYCGAITSITSPINDTSKALVDLKLAKHMVPPEACALLGVFDGLFELIPRIRVLRDKIREARNAGHHMQQLFDPSSIAEALAIDDALRDWKCRYTEDNPRWACSLLYQTCTLIYLIRTIQPSYPIPAIEETVDHGLYWLSKISWGEKNPSKNVMSVLLMPLFLLGCAAFEPRQRPAISLALDTLQEWSKLANIKYARTIVEEVWAKMDAGLEKETWDWEAIIDSHGWDFLIT